MDLNLDTSKAFQAAKYALQANSLLVYVDGAKPLVLACDASPQRLELCYCTLCQMEANN